MEIELKNGEYQTADGRLHTVTGAEEILQRAVFRLKARRGGFAPLPEVGSRLYTLSRLPKAQRPGAARQFVREALAGMENVRLGAVEIREDAGVMKITVELRYAADSAVVAIEV